MRGNAWQITAIIAIILVVVLIIPIVIMGKNHQNLNDQKEQATKERDDVAQKAATLEREVKTLKTLIGRPDADTLQIQVEHAATMEKVLPDESDPARSYHNTIITLLGDLEKEREQHTETSKKKAQLESDFNNANNKYETALNRIRDDLRKAELSLDSEKKRSREEKEVYVQKLDEAQKMLDINLARAEKEKFDLNDRMRQIETDNRDIRETNTNLAALLEDVRNPNVEYPAGKIIAVDQQTGQAVVNLGSADGLLVRTMFSVYHSSITGLSFRTAPVGNDPIYCDVCKREVSRNVSKASVEVMRILGQHRAEVRILDDVLTDPIMVGDVVYSPIWRPGQKRRFALTAGVNLPGAVAGSEAVRRLIELNGGVVDCWIDETAPEGDGYLRGSITDLTNYIVVNEGAARELDPEIARVQDGLLESAKNRAIKKISLGDLLSQMGWKNVTPVHTFGSQAFTSDMRVVPQHQGTVRNSGGAVSPMFTPDNADSRVNAADATPVRSSNGIVTPLFSDKAPPPPSSSGKTSDLFRPRSPATGQNY